MYEQNDEEFNRLLMVVERTFIERAWKSSKVT
ncbi:hypothetical protein T08_14276 [Trichinella sp. T8]|nr:hypothetical protein T08_14276 [Trichinella sp. T8]